MSIYYPNHCTIPSNSSVYAKKKYWLPGGTLSGVLNQWTVPKITAGADKIYWRWSWITLQGGNNQIIILINKYRVNLGSNTLGEYSVYKQLCYLMLKHGVESQDQRK